MSRLRSPILIGCLLLISIQSACGSDVLVVGEPADGGSGGGIGEGGAGPTGGMGVAGGGGGPAFDVEWGFCPPGFDDECAVVALPIDHDDPSGTAIEVMISRSLSGFEDAPQLWMLQGGPGGSAEAFATFFDSIRAVNPAVDIYTIEHRGVGDSTRLGCPTAEGLGSPGGPSILISEMAGCIDEIEEQWGDDLKHFSTTQAARDLQAVIDLTKEPDQDVFVYGVSYGTVWGHRYLQVSGDQATGVILDSIASPGASLHSFGEQWDPIGADVMAFCAADPLCGSKLGPDPMGFIEQVFDKIDAGHCPQLGADRDVLRNINGALLASVIGRTYIAPFFYRLDRCNNADLQALGLFFNNYFGQGGQESGRRSPALGLHIGLSELWADDAPGFQELQAQLDASLFGSNFAAYAGEAKLQWPTYEQDEYVGAFVDTDRPVLMMNGDLDPQTPTWMAQPLGQALTGPNQTYIDIPLSAHGVIYQSWVEPLGDTPCGLSIMMSFIDDPLGTPDTSCLNNLAPIDFAGYAGYVEAHWSGLDPYENGFAAPGTAPPAPASIKLPTPDRTPRGLP